MDQLFTQDVDHFWTTLGIVCRHLSSLRDLLTLEELSALCRSVVRSHHRNEETILRWPSNKDLFPANLQSNYQSIRGPIIHNLRLEHHCAKSVSEVKEGMEWILRTISGRASDLKKLHLDLSSDDKSFQGNYSIGSQLTDLADSILTDPFITFAQCTHLVIDFGALDLYGGTYVCIMPNMLRHFPALEFLSMEGYHLPLLSQLPAPEKLKELKLDFWVGPYNMPLTPSIVVNFAQLETLSLAAEEIYPDVEDDSSYTRLTGVRLLDSINEFRLPKFRELRLNYFSRFSVALLSNAEVVRTCRSLKFEDLTGELESDSIQNVKDLAQRLPGGRLPKVTYLSIETVHSEEELNEILKLTPELQVLRIVNDLADYEDHGELGQDLQCSLRSLTRLLLPKTMRRGWIQSVADKASPTGVKVTLSSYWWDTDCEKLFLTARNHS